MYKIQKFKCRLVKDGSYTSPYSEVDGPHVAAEIMKPLFKDLDREHMQVLYVNTRHGAIGTELVSMGGISGCAITAREVFKGALLSQAAGIVLAHNHPSGDPTPSPEDLAFTKAIVEAGRIMGVALLDHLVIGHDRHTSISDLCPHLF